MRRAKRGSLSRDDANQSSFVEIPPDFEASYFQSAPLDQQLDDLLAGDTILLAGMHPDLPSIRTAVPSRRGVALAETRRGVRIPIPLRLDTIFIDQ